MIDVVGTSLGIQGFLPAEGQFWRGSNERET